jgi:hypothetical protein
MRLEKEYQYRGFELEQAYLGHKINWQEILKKNNIPADQLTREQWEKIIQKLYPDDPLLPKKKWGRDLYNWVADKLKLDIENPEGLYFYNSLGTGLDRMGVDCFFVFKNPWTGKQANFTIDLTLNPKKDKYKADIIVGEMPDHRTNSEDYNLEMEKLADVIAERLKTDTGETIH